MYIYPSANTYKLNLFSLAGPNSRDHCFFTGLFAAAGHFFHEPLQLSSVNSSGKPSIRSYSNIPIGKFYQLCRMIHDFHLRLQ